MLVPTTQLEQQANGLALLKNVGSWFALASQVLLINEHVVFFCCTAQSKEVAWDIPTSDGLMASKAKLYRAARVVFFRSPGFDVSSDLLGRLRGPGGVRGGIAVRDLLLDAGRMPNDPNSQDHQDHVHDDDGQEG